jgi:hypothetical protein
MKKKLIIALLVLLSFGSLQTAQAQSAQNLRIQVNQQKKIPRGNLTVHFVSLLEDSRCPTDTNCIWAGNAKIQVKLRKARGAWQTFEMNTGAEPQTVTFEGYEFRLVDLDPKPATNVRINRNGYTARLEIGKVK